MPRYCDESAFTEAVFEPEIVCVMISSLKNVQNPTNCTVRSLVKVRSQRAAAAPPGRSAPCDWTAVSGGE